MWGGVQRRGKSADVLRKHLLNLEGKEVVARMLRRQRLRGLACGFCGWSGEGRLAEHAAETAGAWGRKETGGRCGVPAVRAHRRRHGAIWKETQRKLW